MTVTSRLHRQKDKERQRKTEEKVERRPVVTPRYESGGEAQALVRPARDRLMMMMFDDMMMMFITIIARD